MAHDFEHKLVWELEQIPGVVDASVEQQDLGLFRVDVVVAEGRVDDIWTTLVDQVDEFERALSGTVGLDLSIEARS